MSERIVEYPWVFENLDLKNGLSILDVGCCGSDICDKLAKQGYNVWGIDLEPVMSDIFKAIKCDIRKTDFSDNFFDRIISVSTIEHVGFIRENNVDDDFKAMKEIKRILKPDGFVLVTIPYNKTFYEQGDFGGFRIYDEKRLLKLFESFKIIKKDFFRNLDYPNKSPSDNWVKADEKDAIDSEDVNMIACVKAMK